MPSKTSQSRNSASILAQGFLRSSMFSTAYQHNLHPFRRYISFALLGITLVTSAGLLAQDQAPAQPGTPGQQKQEPPPAAGGPQSDTGPYAIPKKKEEPPLPPPEKPKKVEGMPDYSIKVDVPLVNVDVLVTTKNGQFVPGLSRETSASPKMARHRPSPTSISRKRPSLLCFWSSLRPPIITS